MTDSRANRICVIMAGGSGERFWPLSRRLRPKQLLRLSNADLNLLEETVERIAPLLPRENVFIATSRHLQEPIRRGGAGVPDENVLAEPCKRNTAGCLAFAAAHAIARFGGEGAPLSMAVLSADHLVPDRDRFLAAVSTALDVVEREPAIAVLGVRPTRPETGYGYIEIAEGAEPVAAPKDGPPVFPVKAFREKPDAETAAEFLASERFFWNSGMFFWTLDTFLSELAVASPAHADATRAMTEAVKAGDEARVEELFTALENISIDYALMEKARRVVCVRADFEWDDIGAWDAMDRTQPHDENGNVAVGNPILADTRDCIVYNEPGSDKMAVAAVGCEGLAIIVAEDSVLVIPKDRAQDVRKAVEALKERGAAQL